jgi:hypothetical protein
MTTWPEQKNYARLVPGEGTRRMPRAAPVIVVRVATGAADTMASVNKP